MNAIAQMGTPAHNLQTRILLPYQWATWMVNVYDLNIALILEVFLNKERCFDIEIYLFILFIKLKGLLLADYVNVGVKVCMLNAQLKERVPAKMETFVGSLEGMGVTYFQKNYITQARKCLGTNF